MNKIARCYAVAVAAWMTWSVAGCGSRPLGEPATSAAVENAAVDGSAKQPAVGRSTPPAVVQANYVEPAKDAAGAESDADADDATASRGQAKPAFDPIKQNGKFFEGWPKPKLALVITGRQSGYLEPCGCAGLENQKGGLSRRHSLFKDLAARGWPVTAVDLGSLVRRFGKQAEFQFAASADALKAMDYGAVGFGPADLKLSVGDVVAAVAGAEPSDSIFVSANVSLFGLTPRSKIIKVGDMTLGVTSVLGKEYQAQINNSEVEITPAAQALAEVAPELAGCDVRILLAQATRKETESLAAKFPTFNIVVTADGSDVPPAQPEKLRGGKTMLIEVGEKAQYAIVLGFYQNAKTPIRYQRVALDSRFPDSDRMKQLMVGYQNQLQQFGWDGLGLRRVAAPEAKQGDKLSGKFVGAASCKECHQAAWDVWAASNHAHATETLVGLDPPRHFDPECVSCHVTGWNAQENFPYAMGFDSLASTPLLKQNGCENCHGPGAAHVAAERGNDQARRRSTREALKLSWPDAKDTTCVKCHDHDNSPEFERNADKYWDQIAH
jgi:hypothetical protein